MFIVYGSMPGFFRRSIDLFHYEIILWHEIHSKFFKNSSPLLRSSPRRFEKDRENIKKKKIVIQLINISSGKYEVIEFDWTVPFDASTDIYVYIYVYTHMLFRSEREDTHAAKSYRFLLVDRTAED